ncbi:MAG: hypothetical protein ACTTJO_01290 [Metamycoplasmataceae bacterium]
MNFIRLKYILATGENVKESKIDFGNKLTIIAGPSNTGKTCIFKCIDYILGAKNETNNYPFDENDGYDTITLKMETSKGDILLKRKQKSNSIFVESNNFENGEYLLKPNKNNKKTINDLLLKIMDINPNLKLPKNKSGEVASFTWRMIKKYFFIDENRIDDESSIFILNDNNLQTLFLSSLIYFISQDELDIYKNTNEAKKIRKIKNDSIIKYILQKEDKLLEYEKNIKTQFLNFFNKENFNIDLNDRLDNLIFFVNSKLNEINNYIVEYSNKYKEITEKKLKIENKIVKNNFLLKKFNNLLNAYQADINRLIFINESQENIQKIKINMVCPYCENDLKNIKQDSYAASSKSELRKLINNFKDLQNLNDEIKLKIKEDETLLNSLNEEKNKFYSFLNNKNLLLQQKKLIEFQKTLDILMKEKSILQLDKEKIKNEFDIEKPINFNAKDFFYKLVFKSLEEKIKNILEKLEYKPLNSVIFDKSNLDLIVNDKKRINNGKGYRAFMNSVLILGFRELLSYDVSIVNNYHFYLFDSPLKGLHLSENEILNYRNIRKNYFKYLIENNINDQIIIMENTNDNELPNFNFSNNEDIKIYNFTQDENDGRYGFLLDVKRK